MTFLRPLLLFIFSAFAAVLLPAAPASAHAVQVSSDPARGAVLAAPPGSVSVTFNEQVSRVGDALLVVSPNGEFVHTGRATLAASGEELRTNLSDDLPDGTYLVAYQVVSADGHPVTGGYTFSIRQKSEIPELPEGAESSIALEARIAVSTGRYLTYAGAALLTGAVVMLMFLWPRRLNTNILRKLGWIGWWSLLSGTTVWLIAQVPYGYGGPILSSDIDAWRETLTSTVGISLLTRLVLLILAVPLLRRTLHGEILTRAHRIIGGVLAVALALTWPLAGHAATSIAKFVSIPADAVHIGAVSVWLGGLCVLVIATLKRANAKELEVILPTWSRWAMYAIAAIILTGTAEALLQLGRLSALLSTTYGALVLAKIAGAGVIVALGYAARRITLRSGGDTNPPARKLRRLVFIEVGVAAAILGVATVLVQEPPANVSSSLETEQLSGYGAQIKSGDLLVDFQLDPGARGANTMHAYAFDVETGSDVPVEEWTITAALPEKDIAPISVPLVKISPNHVTGEVYLPLEGEWEFTLVVRTSEVDQVTVENTVTIE